MSCVGHLQPHQQARIYVRKEHLSLVRPRCSALEMYIFCTFPSDCSTNWGDQLFGPRYSDTVEFYMASLEYNFGTANAFTRRSQSEPIRFGIENRRCAGETSAAPQLSVLLTRTWASRPRTATLTMAAAARRDRRAWGTAYIVSHCWQVTSLP